MPTENSVPKNTPSVNPPVDMEHVASLSIEDQLINACVRFHHARTSAHRLGLDCMHAEQNGAGRPAEIEQGGPRAISYLQIAREYRQALAEMSAARYELSVLLGW